MYVPLPQTQVGVKSYHVIIWLAVFAVGFFAGTAWKSTDGKEQSPGVVDQEVSDTIPEQSLRILTQEESATIRLFEEAAPSVVFITAISVRRDYWSRNVLEVPRGSGSGFIWDKEGHIVTNFHVIRGGQRFQATLADQSVWDAEVIGVAPDKDLAVLRIAAPADVLPPMAIGTSNDLQVGQFVYAIGNPFGLDQTLTTGVISALGREIESLTRRPIRDVIQTDAAINPGNSGGPLLDSSGKLIGVNTQIYSPSGASAGIGFAIPADAVRWVVPDLIEFGELRRPVLGVELVASSTTRRLGMEGALIWHVAPGSPAEQAGLISTNQSQRGKGLGDLIVQFGDEKISSNIDLILALEKYEPGDQVPVKVKRKTRTVDVLVTLGESDNQ